MPFSYCHAAARDLLSRLVPCKGPRVLLPPCRPGQCQGFGALRACGTHLCRPQAPRHSAPWGPREKRPAEEQRGRRRKIRLVGGPVRGRPADGASLVGASAGVAQGGVRCERARPAQWPDSAVPAGGQVLQALCRRAGWSWGPGEGAAGPEGGCRGGGRAADPGPAATPPPVFGWIHFLTDELLVLRIPLSPSTRQAHAVPGPGLL